MYSDSQSTFAELPLPDEYALAHSQALQQVIHTEIAANDGHIGFDRFMQMALYEPGLGYYSAGSSKFGESGDFITAPEISPLFSFCVARQCAEVMDQLDHPVILELGAGSGVMASDILLELKRLDCLPETYYILEPSADLRQRQEKLLSETLPELVAKVCWLDSLPAASFEGVILANEVLDAMPVKRFCLREKEIRELHVSSKDEQFNWQEVEAGETLRGKIETITRQSINGFKDGYCSELNMDIDTWLKSLSGCLQRGLMLFIDYGYSRHEYYHEQRSQGTLLCHYRHRVHSNPFICTGLQDITASVDFTALAEAALETGLKVSGFTSQAYFLIACGLERVLQDQQHIDEKQYLEFARQVKILTLPAEMGERFRVMALSRNLEQTPAGFSLVDQRRRL